MIAGTQSMSVFKDTRKLAAKAFEMADAILKGYEPTINDEKTYNNGTGIIPTYLCEPVAGTIHNFEELLIDSGYYRRAQLGLE
jgi:putative multiple sugar transport system substrate-binding protein